MENLSEEVDALFELSDQRYFEIWRKLAQLTIDTVLSYHELYDRGDRGEGS
jgi:hypothetical protein